MTLPQAENDFLSSAFALKSRESECLDSILNRYGAQ